MAGAPGGFHTTHGSFPASPTELSLEINDKAARLTIMTQERNTEDLGFLASVSGKSPFILHLKQAFSRDAGLLLGNKPREDLGLYPLTSDDRD